LEDEFTLDSRSQESGDGAEGVNGDGCLYDDDYKKVITFEVKKCDTISYRSG